MYSEMHLVWQNPIQRTIRTAHLSVLMIVHNCRIQCTAQNSSDNLPSYLQTNTIAQILYMYIRGKGTVVCYILPVIGSILWGHSGPLCHALSLLSWTSMRRRRATVAACNSSDTWWMAMWRWLAVANGPNIFQMLLVSEVNAKHLFI